LDQLGDLSQQVIKFQDRSDPLADIAKQTESLRKTVCEGMIDHGKSSPALSSYTHFNRIA
jgi:hypothetical protein